MTRDKSITTFETLRPEQQRRAIINHLVSGGYVQASILQWHVRIYALSRSVSYEIARQEIVTLARETLEIKLTLI